MSMPRPTHDDSTDYSPEFPRLWRLAIDNARIAVGREVFEFQPAVIRRALVAEQVLILLAAQDADEVSDARVRALLTELTETVARWQR